MNTQTVLQSKKNINALTTDEKQQLIKSIYAEKSYFNTIFNSDYLTGDCKAATTALRNAVETILLQKKIVEKNIKLEELHNAISDDLKTYNYNDGVNKISTLFYDAEENLKVAYFNFIAFLRKTFLEQPFYFQSTPTIRIHCPNAANSHHYPRYHSDISYGHPPEEINLWLPLTEPMEGHGFRLMDIKASNQILRSYRYNFDAFINDAIHNSDFTQRCEADSFPVNTALGEFFAFDSRCIHSGEPLKSHTRISMDIRIVPVERYNQMNIEYQGSGRRKILFSPGNCYHTLNSDQLIDIQGL